LLERHPDRIEIRASKLFPLGDDQQRVHGCAGKHANQQS
jgi:hypothetical protein